MLRSRPLGAQRHHSDGAAGPMEPVRAPTEAAGRRSFASVQSFPDAFASNALVRARKGAAQPTSEALALASRARQGFGCSTTISTRRFLALFLAVSLPDTG